MIIAVTAKGRSESMPDIDYSRIPYKEERTHERCEKNAFYMPKCGEDSEWYTGYDSNDFFRKPNAEPSGEG